MILKLIIIYAFLRLSVISEAGYANDLKPALLVCIKELNISLHGHKAGEPLPNLNCLQSCILEKLYILNKKGVVNVTGMPDLFIRPAKKCAAEFEMLDPCERAPKFLACPGSKVREDIEELAEICEDETGIKFKIEKFPSGEFTGANLFKILKAENACFMHCLFSKLQLIDQYNGIVFDAYSQYIAEFDKLAELSQKCEKITKRNKCEEVQIRAKCMLKAALVKSLPS